MVASLVIEKVKASKAAAVAAVSQVKLVGFSAMARERLVVGSVRALQELPVPVPQAWSVLLQISFQAGDAPPS